MNFMISWFGQVGVKIYYIRRKKNPIPRSQLKYSAYAPGVFDLHYFRIRVVAKGKNFNRKFIIFKMAGWIFPIFCMKLDIIKGKNFTKGNFPKIFGSSIKYKIVHFWGFFAIFSSTTWNILTIFCQNVVQIGTNHVQKTNSKQARTYVDPRVPEN